MPESGPNPFVYLLWSNSANAWWAAGTGAGHTKDVWQAGRFDKDAAASTCAAFTPAVVVMVLAPEYHHAPFTAAQLREEVPDMMQRRVRDATDRAVADAYAARQPGYPPVHVYFLHDTLTPRTVRAVRDLAAAPAVGDVFDFPHAGYEGAAVTWRVTRVEITEQGGSATAYMTDAGEGHQ
jgi:hypothetical protein